MGFSLASVGKSSKPQHRGVRVAHHRQFLAVTSLVLVSLAAVVACSEAVDSGGISVSAGASLLESTPRGQASGISSSFPTSSASETSAAPSSETGKAGPLSGHVIALDPGHNRGNFQHLDEINEPLFVGIWKTCNTTGTATDSGYLEADYNWEVVMRLADLLEVAGAEVHVSRADNSDASWGPCIDERAAFGAAVGADVMVSVHADGGPDSGYGHYVIAPGGLEGYSDDIAVQSRKLAEALLSGMGEVDLPQSTYVSESVLVSDDYGTLNLADVPTVIVETLNMRNQSDAALAESEIGRQQVAEGIFKGLITYFSDL